MNTSPDAVVIGGGLSGLAAATYLARNGLRTSVLERSSALGGRAVTDAHKGFALNRGAHALYTGGPASSVLAELGVSYTWGVPRNALARTADGLHPFPAGARDLLRTNLFDAADKADLMRVLVRLATLRPASLAEISVIDLIAQTTRRPRVAQMLEAVARVSLYTRAVDIASADVFVERFQQSMKHPVHYVNGGWQSLVDGLRQAAISAGVEILASASASRLRPDRGRASGVVLHDGRELSCDSVILATPPEDAAHLLPEQSPTRQALNSLMPVHIATLDLALQRLPVPRNAVVFDIEQPRFLTAQSAFAAVAPEGGAVVHILAQLDPREAGDPARERASLEALMDQAQPGWRDLVVEQRFLPRMLASGALPTAARGGLPARPAHRSRELDNVYFAGDWVGPENYLADAALASARTAAQLLVAERQPALAAA